MRGDSPSVLRPDPSIMARNESLRAARESAKAAELSYAEVMLSRLLDEVLEFESGLAENQEIAACLTQFGVGVEIRVTSISARNPYLILFHGERLDDGSRVTLAQHVSQVNVLFKAAKVEENREPRRIGFRQGEVETDSIEPTRTG